MEFTKDQYEFIYKKLEYRFKKSGHSLVKKIESHQKLSDDDLHKLLSKFEYTFRKKGHSLIDEIKKHLLIEHMPNIKYSVLTKK